MMALPKTIEAALIQWVAEQDSAWLETMAQSRAPLLPVLQEEFGPFKLRLMKTLLSSRDKQAIRSMSRKEWDALLTALVERAPGTGVIFWEHQRWYYAQMASLQTYVVSMLFPAPGYTASIGGE